MSSQEYDGAEQSPAAQDQAELTSPDSGLSAESEKLSAEALIEKQQEIIRNSYLDLEKTSRAYRKSRDMIEEMRGEMTQLSQEIKFLKKANNYLLSVLQLLKFSF